jgi:uncharacterized membrane protein YhaH (DUF805 family)
LIVILLQEEIDSAIAHSSRWSSFLKAADWVGLLLLALGWLVATVLRLRDLKWPIWLVCAFTLPWLAYSWVESNPRINGTPVDLVVFIALELTQAPLVFLPAKTTADSQEAATAEGL